MRLKGKVGGSTPMRTAADVGCAFTWEDEDKRLWREKKIREALNEWALGRRGQSVGLPKLVKKRKCSGR